MALVYTANTSPNTYLRALQEGYVWSDTGNHGDHVDIRYTFAGSWTTVEKNAYRAAIESWAAVANFSATETTSFTNTELIARRANNTTMNGLLGMHETPLLAWENGTEIATGWFNVDGDGWDENSATGGLSVGGYGHLTLLHEIGHGLGLLHPHDGGVNLFPGVTSEASTGSNGLNQNVWSVMSYLALQSPATANTNTTGSSAWSSNGQPVLNYGYHAGPMAFDIAAIQHLYGANTGHRTGNDTYVLPDANAVGTYWSCIWDAGGTDTMQYNGTRDTIIDLTAATLDNSPTGGGVLSYASGIMGGYTIANGVTIENATGGSGRDTIRGNAAANVIDGRVGADTMRGLGGGDTYYVDNAADIVEELANNGYDRVFASRSYTLTNNVEELTLTGSALQATGNNIVNTLVGNAANNTLDGRGGADVMRGLGGSDTYYVDNVADIVEEAAVVGEDNVVASVSYTLAANVENLALTGAATTGTGNGLDNILDARSLLSVATLNGNGGSDVLYGSSFSDILNGGEGADMLYGHAGLNKMSGGIGDDFYASTSSTDIVQEGANAGWDILVTTYSVAQLVANVEELWVSGNVATANGNGLNNRIDAGQSTRSVTMSGGNGTDTILGSGFGDTIEGGAMNDMLWGRGGADRFRFAAAGTGNDTIRDFQDGIDRIDLAGRGFSAASLGSQITIGGTTSAVIDLGNDHITLIGISKASITAADFVF